MNIKRIAINSLVVFVVCIFCGYFAYYSYQNRLIRVKEFRGMKEGCFFPAFSATSDKGTHFTSTEPSGDFFVYFINENNPGIIQFDLENGSKADIALMNSGHVIADVDEKTLRTLHINAYDEKTWWKKISTFRKPPKPHDLITRLDASLMIVTDRDAKIIGIYINAKWQHLNHILSDLHLIKSCKLKNGDSKGPAPLKKKKPPTRIEKV